MSIYSKDIYNQKKVELFHKYTACSRPFKNAITYEKLEILKALSVSILIWAINHYEVGYYQENGHNKTGANAIFWQLVKIYISFHNYPTQLIYTADWELSVIHLK